MEGQARRTEYAVTDDRMFLCAIHTTHSDSQSIACWPFLNRDSRLHLLNFLFRQFRSGSFRAFKSGMIHESRSGKRPTFPA